jgi:hypothetical protein
MIPIRKIKLPERKTENPVTRIQINRHFETQKEMEDFVKANHSTATIKQFWPVQVLACVIEFSCVKK